MEIKEKGCVYFFRHIGLSPIKIGYSTNNSPIVRFNQFKTYAPYGSEILGFIQTDEAKEIETKLHIKYSQKRLSGEWFEITEKDVNDEINFYSNIEDIKERNNFQIAWANELNRSKDDLINTIETSNQKKNKLLKKYKENPKINKSKLAKEIGISRRCFYNWINNK
jgi:DNA-binding XRE family transcriptional regulator